MLPEESKDLLLFVGNAGLQTRIGDVICRAGVAKYHILPLVEPALKGELY